MNATNEGLEQEGPIYLPTKQSDRIAERPERPGMANMVFREIRDSNCNKLGLIAMQYDGSIEDALLKAEIITDKMFGDFQGASNIQSRIGAFDKYGYAKYVISPNFRHIAEVGTREAVYIWGVL